ncbi:MAG: hypothetical protein GXP49_09805 [Deltaproteobacteria bacterium]|nr:hypothetical protein [Deltaproteobacteria bacterium]
MNLWYIQEKIGLKSLGIDARIVHMIKHARSAMQLSATFFVMLMLAFIMLSGAAMAFDEVPVLNARLSSPMSGPVSLEYEASYGTRDTRFLGLRGFEQAFRIQVRPYERIGLQAWAGTALRDGAVKGTSLGAMASFRLLSQHDSSKLLNLDVAVGVLRDYRGETLPRLQVVMERDIGRIALSAAGMLEIPHSPARDDADIVLGVAGRYNINEWYTQGIEVRVEDLEGIWETDEAEGGAKLLLGPWSSFEVAGGLFLTAGAGLLVNLSHGQPGFSGKKFGIMARAGVAYSF